MKDFIYVFGYFWTKTTSASRTGETITKFSQKECGKFMGWAEMALLREKESFYQNRVEIKWGLRKY